MIVCVVTVFAFQSLLKSTFLFDHIDFDNYQNNSLKSIIFFYVIETSPARLFYTRPTFLAQITQNILSKMTQ